MEINLPLSGSIDGRCWYIQALAAAAMIIDASQTDREKGEAGQEHIETSMWLISSPITQRALRLTSSWLQLTTHNHTWLAYRFLQVWRSTGFWFHNVPVLQHHMIVNVSLNDVIFL